MRALVALAPQHHFVCFGDRRAFEAFPLDASNVERVTVALDESPTVAAAADGARTPRDMLRLTRAVWASRPDVFFSPSVYTYFPLPPRQRAVVTIHDATLVTEEDALGSVIGKSALLPAGTHENVRVRLERDLAGDSETLVAMPHKDS
ncbi:MAG: hypothetical protein ACLGIK_07090, partial [Gemmatimonadota bacterium]